MPQKRLVGAPAQPGELNGVCFPVVWSRYDIMNAGDQLRRNIEVLERCSMPRYHAELGSERVTELLQQLEYTAEVLRKLAPSFGRFSARLMFAQRRHRERHCPCFDEPNYFVDALLLADAGTGSPLFNSNRSRELQAAAVCTAPDYEAVDDQTAPNELNKRANLGQHSALEQRATG